MSTPICVPSTYRVKPPKRALPIASKDFLAIAERPGDRRWLPGVPRFVCRKGKICNHLIAAASYINEATGKRGFWLSARRRLTAGLLGTAPVHPAKAERPPALPPP